MNWAGFSSGLTQGLNLADRLGQQYDQARMARIRSEGMAEAKAAREAAMQQAEQSVVDTQAQASQAAQLGGAPGVAGPRTGSVVPDTHEVRTQSVPMPAAAGLPRMGPDSGLPAEASPAPAPAAPPMTSSAAPTQRFQVGGRGFDTREAAVAAAQKKVPSVQDFVINTVAPKMQDWYVGQGDLDSAERLGQYMESRRGREATKSFGNAMQKLMFTDDVDAGVKALGDYYNQYIDDGVDFTKGEQLPDGRLRITVKQRDGGAERQMDLNKAELVRMGMAHDPVQLFKMGLAQVEAGEKSAADAAKDSREFKQKVQLKKMDIAADNDRQQAGFDNDTRKAQTAQGYKLEEIATREQLEAAGIGKKERAKVQAKVDILRENGLPPDAVRDILPQLLGGDAYKKSTSPDEARRMLLTEHAKDMMWSKKSPEEQRKIIDQEMDVIYGKPKQPQATPPAPGKRPGGVPVFDSKTGQIIYR